MNTTILPFVQPPSPYERAKHVYTEEPCARSFEEDLELHLKYGYVFSTATAFIMGRPVRHDAPSEWVVDPHHVFHNADAWLIYLAAGDLREFFTREPYPLPWVGWERNNVLRFYRMDDIKGRICS